MTNRYCCERTRRSPDITKKWANLMLLRLVLNPSMMMVESLSMTILSACNTYLSEMIPTSVALNSAFGEDGSKRKEPPIARYFPSESWMIYLALSMVLQTLPSKFTLTNCEGGDSQKIKKILWITAEAAWESQEFRTSMDGLAAS